jgi:hypothetical protein
VTRQRNQRRKVTYRSEGRAGQEGDFQCARRRGAPFRIALSGIPLTISWIDTLFFAPIVVAFAPVIEPFHALR